MLPLAALTLAVTACSGESDDEAGRPSDAGAMADAAAPTCIEVAGDIRSNEVWQDHIADPAIPDYCITRSVIVRRGALLTVEPGVSVVFSAGTSLRVDRAEGAALEAVGTAEAPIEFRGERAEAGFYEGIEVMSDDPRNRFAHVRISDAGGGGDVKADDELGGVPGALILDAEPGEKASASVTDCTFERNLGFGLVVEWIAELDEFARNSFLDNSLGALLLSQANVHKVDSATTFRGNGFDGVSVTAVTNLKLPEAVTWQPLSSPYWIRETLVVLSDLTIAGGASLVFAGGTGLDVRQNADNTAAQLVIAGTAEAPVTMRGESEGRGTWSGLEIASGRSNNRIAHAEISHAVKAIRLRKAGAFPAAVLSVQNTVIQASSECGIENTSADNMLTLTDVTFADNASDRCDP